MSLNTVALGSDPNTKVESQNRKKHSNNQGSYSPNTTQVSFQDEGNSGYHESSGGLDNQQHRQPKESSIIDNFLDFIISPAYAEDNFAQEKSQDTKDAWAKMAWRVFKGDQGPEVKEWQLENRKAAPKTYIFLNEAANERETLNRPLHNFKRNLNENVEENIHENSRKLEGLNLTGFERAVTETKKVAWQGASLGIDIFIPGSIEHLGTDLALFGLTKAGQAPLRGVDCLYEGHKARKAANVAEHGGKYAGELRNMLGRNRQQLEKSISSYEKQAKIHIEKIKNPKKYTEGWDSFSKSRQDSLIQRWQRDSDRANAYKELAKRVLKDKRNNITKKP